MNCKHHFEHSHNNFGSKVENNLENNLENSIEFTNSNTINNPMANPTGYFPEGSRFNYTPDIVAKTKHIFLDIKTEVDGGKVEATAILSLELALENTTELVLDANGMQISGVWVDDKAVDFDHDGAKLQVDLPLDLNSKNIKLKIVYSLQNTPHSSDPGLHFSFPTSEYPNSPVQVWSQGESQENSYWFPCFDYPKQISTSEVRVTVPNGFTAISNGALVSEVENLTENGDYKTYHWHQAIPHPTYLVALTIGKFCKIEEKHQTTAGEVLLEYYARDERKADLVRSIDKTPAMLDFLVNFFGTAFPWQKYTQVWVYDFIFGGMENTSCTFNKERSLLDEKAYYESEYNELLVVHEMAHQWFGDLVVVDFWANLWIKEGMASYAERAWFDHHNGYNEGQYFGWQEEQIYFNEGYTRPTSSNYFREFYDMYDAHSYAKAGCIYHSLRQIIEQKTGNPKIFTTILAKFLEANRHQNVDGNKLLGSIEQVSGLNLKPILDQYIYRAGHPKLKLEWSWEKAEQKTEKIDEISVKSAKKLLKLSIEQTQAKDDKDIDNLFNLESVPVIFNLQEGGKVMEYININQKNQTYYFAMDAKPEWVDFDPNSNFLKEVELPANVKELSVILKNSPFVYSQLNAVKALAKKGSNDAFTALVEKLNQQNNQQETFWGVSVEIIKVLDTFAPRLYEPVLIQFATHSNRKIRAASLANMSKLGTRTAFDFLLKIVKDTTSPNSIYIDSNFAPAAAISSMGSVASTLELFGDESARIEAEEFLQEFLKGKNKLTDLDLSWNGVIEVSALKALSYLYNSAEALKTIISFCGVGIERNLRASAVAALGQASKNRVWNGENGEVGMILDTIQNQMSDNWMFAELGVIQALGAIPSNRSASMLTKMTQKTVNGKMRMMAEMARTKVLANLKPNKNYLGLQKDILKMQKDNQELKARLDKLEAGK